MTNPIELVDQQRLELTMSTRENIIRKLTSNNSIPSDQDDRMLLIASLDGLDRAVVQKSKLKIDAASNDVLAQSSDLIANLIMKRSQHIRNTQPILGDAYVVENPVEGEKETSDSNIDYEQFALKNNIV